MENHRFLLPAPALQIAATHGTPCYVYDEATLSAQADAMLAFPNAFGLTVRFAMKACPNAAILKLFAAKGLHFDASSGWEVRRAMHAGVPADRISLSSQELPDDFVDLLNKGAHVNACSLQQLRRIGQALPGHEIGLRFNPGRGSGGNGKTNVGGPDSSFGIWHEWADEAQAIVREHGLKVVRIHTHIGSGSDPVVWQEVSAASLALVRRFPGVHTLNLGGGYKVARIATEKGTDPQVVGAPVKVAFEQFAQADGRRLRLEIEPGTFLVANAGAVLARVQDVVSTGQREFLKLDTGMTELLRPSLYGSQHPTHLYPARPTAAAADYVIVGHCCESGDLISCAPGEPETLATRRLPAATVGDLCVIGGAGAYCAGMSTKNYNSFPEAPEVLLRRDGSFVLIRRRQSLEQILQNELPAAGL
ncbi:MAG: Diaminopimelate decarboxylase [Verrucomicrobiota bacterium]